MNVIKKIFDDVKNLKNVSISTTDLISITSNLIKIILLIIPETCDKIEEIFPIVDISVELIKFIIPEKISCYCCCC